MRLLYTGELLCSGETLRRLLLVAEEIAFMDRPSVNLGAGGTIGMQSPWRQVRVPTDSPVKISVHAPPSGIDEKKYATAIAEDISNPRFVTAFFEALRTDPNFPNKVIQLQGKYGTMRPGGDEHLGSEVLAAVLADPAATAPHSETAVKWPLTFDISTTEGRRETAKMLLIEVSIQITEAIIISTQQQMSPVTDNASFAKLLSLRSSPNYLDGTAPLSPLLGLEFVKAVIPDEVLAQLQPNDILDYRKEAKEPYAAWAIQVNRIAAKIGDVDPENASLEIQRLVVTELAPAITEYHHEMQSARDRLFGDLIKRFTTYHVPALSVAYLHFGVSGALLALVSGVSPVVGPPIVDFVRARNDAGRKHPVSYLIGARKI